MQNKKIGNWIFFIELIILIIPAVNAYNVEPNEEVHQYLTNESQTVWEQTPNKIKRVGE